jgi:hypothetical protein
LVRVRLSFLAGLRSGRRFLGRHGLNLRAGVVSPSSCVRNIAHCRSASSESFPQVVAASWPFQLACRWMPDESPGETRDNSVSG